MGLSFVGARSSLVDPVAAQDASDLRLGDVTENRAVPAGIPWRRVSSSGESTLLPSDLKPPPAMMKSWQEVADMTDEPPEEVQRWTAKRRSALIVSIIVSIIRSEAFRTRAVPAQGTKKWHRYRSLSHTYPTPTGTGVA